MSYRPQSSSPFQRRNGPPSFNGGRRDESRPFSRGRGGGSGGNGGSWNRRSGGPSSGPRTSSHSQIIGEFVHKVGTEALFRVTDSQTYPIVDSRIYNEKGEQIGVVSEVLGPITEPFFVFKPLQGVTVSNFKTGSKVRAEPTEIRTIESLVKASAAEAKPKGKKMVPKKGPNSARRPMALGGRGVRPNSGSRGGRGGMGSRSPVRGGFGGDRRGKGSNGGFRGGVRGSRGGGYQRR